MKALCSWPLAFVVCVGVAGQGDAQERVAQDRSSQGLAEAISRAAGPADLAELILATKERSLGEPFDAAIRAALKSRMEALSMEQLAALAKQGELADIPAALGSVTSDLVYTPVIPCRAFDSRPSQGGPGPIPANSQRNVFVSGTIGFPAQGGLAGGCGVPVGATSVIINFVAVGPAGAGNIRAWAVADPQPAPPLAAVLNYGTVAGLPAIANGVAVPLCNPAATSCALGDLRLQADTSATNLLGDVVGYFGPVTGLVTSVNSITGPVTIAAGANISVTPSGDTLTIANTAPVNPGTVTSVGSGSGLTGGPIIGAGSLSIASGGVATSMIANGAVGAAQITTGAIGLTQIDTAQVQARVGSICGAGASIRVVNADGTVACEVDDNSGGTVTSVTAGAGLSGGTFSNTGTVAVATGGIISTMIANGAVGGAQINQAEVQARVASTCPTGSAIQQVNLDGTVTCLAAVAPPTFAITTLDSTGDVGLYTSITIGTDGLALMSYVDITNWELKVAHCANTACSTATTATLESSVLVGPAPTSITIGTDGLGLISYSDFTNDDLKVAHCSNTACSTATTATLDSTGAGYDHTSITIGTDGLGLISYYDLTNGDLKVAHCSNTACSAATTATLDSTDDVGRYTSITIGTDGLGLISYYDVTNGDLKVAHCSNTACSTATTATLDSTGDVGWFTSITVGTDGLGLITYSGANDDLKVAHCSNTACSTATIATLDSTGNVGWFTSITIGTDGLGLISYRDITNLDLKVAHCSNAACSTATTATLDSNGDVGWYTSITIGTDGLGLISYYDYPNGDLKAAHCSNALCTPTPFNVRRR